MQTWMLLAGFWLGALILLSGSVLMVLAEPQPGLLGTRLLVDGKLVVEVDDPAAPGHNRYNRDARRFSPAAMVLRAQFNGKEFLYSPANGGEYGNVGGAPMEFDLGENSMNKPPGFDEASPGATDGTGDFLKVGVGILRKDHTTYNWGHNYPSVELAGIQAAWDTNGAQVVFQQTLKGNANGYACELEVIIRLQEPQMVMEYRLKNTGRKRLVTEQYIHNFLAFSERPVGPDYEVRVPYDFQLAGEPGPAVGRRPGDNVIEFQNRLPKAVKFRVSTPLGYQGPNALTIVQTSVRQLLVIEASLPSHGIDLWCTDRQLSPEMLLLIALEPGQEKRWTRTYTFSDTVK
jgi:hypothetical protein